MTTGNPPHRQQSVKWPPVLTKGAIGLKNGRLAVTKARLAIHRGQLDVFKRHLTV